MLRTLYDPRVADRSASVRRGGETLRRRFRPDRPARRWLALTALLAAAATGAHAGDLFASGSGLGASPLKLDAFGTLGAVYQDSPGLAFRRSVGQGHGARAGEIDFGTDSLLGLQLGVNTSFGLNAQFQGIVRRNAFGLWQPELARAFLRYEPNQTVMVRAGRIGLSLYLRGATPDVGYSYLPIRPPEEVYGLLPSNHFDGADLTLTRVIGSGVGKLRLFGGGLSYEIGNANGSVTSMGNNTVLGITGRYLEGDWETLVVLVQFHNHDTSANPLARALLGTHFPQAAAFADELTKSPQNVLVMGFGTSYTGNRLRATAVYARLDSDYVTGPKANTGYLLLGWRLSQVTPYALYSISDSFASTQPAGLPPLPVFEPLIEGVYQAQVAAQTTQRDFALGVRYDFAPHMDIKAQVDHIWLHQSMLIFDYNVPPFGHASMTVAGVALDFAF